MPTLIFASDSHLNRHYGRMTPEQLMGRRRWLREGFKQTVDLALAVGADLYIHGGDLFDGPNPRATEMIWVAGQFQRLADAGIQSLLIGGNHDIPRTRAGGATPQRLFMAVRQAHVFTDPTRVEWWTGEVGGLRLAVGGLPPDPRLERVDPLTHEPPDPLARLVEPIAPPDADLVLLVTHYAVEGTLVAGAEEPTIRKASIAALAGKVHQLLVGHIHSAKDMDVDGVRVAFPGPTERMGFGELELPCGFLELRLEGRGKLRLQRHRIQPQPMRRETVRATDIPREDPTGWLIERLRRWSHPEQLLQLRLEGPLARETYHDLRFLDLMQAGTDLNFYFDLDRHGLSLDHAELLAPDISPGVRPSPRGEIRTVAAAMLAAAEEPQERELLAEALEMALESYGGGGMEEGE